MNALTRSAVPHRNRASHDPLRLASRPGFPCGKMAKPDCDIIRVAVAFVLMIALIPPAMASAFPGPGEPAVEGDNAGSGAAAGPAIAPGVTGPSVYPSITSNESTGTLSRHVTFPFQKTTIAITARVNASVYYGAKNGDKFATVPEGMTPSDAAPAYYRAFIEDPRQEEMYRDLLETFRAVRQEHGLTDDEYLELLTVFVQSLPYDTFPGTRPDTPARFPAETLIDGKGDCDDKSLLLAGLLAREGYDTALLLYLPEHHMAVGVKDPGARYGDAGYLYVETTGLSLVGALPSNLSQSPKYVPDGQSPHPVPLQSTPLVIREGNGSRAYSRGNETAFIAEQKRTVDADIALLRHQLDAFPGDDPIRYRRLMEDYYVYTGIHNTLVTRSFDRAGEYQYLVHLAPVYLCAEPSGNRTAGQLALPLPGPDGAATLGSCLPLTLHRPGQYGRTDGSPVTGG